MPPTDNRQKSKSALVEKIVFETEYPLKEILKLIAIKESQGYRTRSFLSNGKISLVCKLNVGDTVLSLDDRARITDLCSVARYKIPTSHHIEREIFLYIGADKTITIRLAQTSPNV